ncbi:MAG: hypothetical protein NTY86_19865, partial [Deltaproteobacteria bacterium]|nr:hypothetical protein [Deltaproteobacteria bacterium]
MYPDAWVAPHLELKKLEVIFQHRMEALNQHRDRPGFGEKEKFFLIPRLGRGFQVHKYEIRNRKLLIIQIGNIADSLY